MEKLVRSFKYAFEGIWYAVKNERNMRIHVIALMVMCICGWYFEISASEWIAQVILYGLVIGGEMFNTAIERISDGLYPQRCREAKIIKDVSSGAVLILSIAAFAVGLIIYVPKLISL